MLRPLPLFRVAAMLATLPPAPAALLPATRPPSPPTADQLPRPQLPRYLLAPRESDRSRFAGILSSVQAGYTTARSVAF